MLTRIILVNVALLLPLSVQAALNVFACEPEWAALVSEIGKEQVRVTAATTAQQDPHAIQARPSLIAGLRKADLLICTGAGLEDGWLPLLQRRASNPAVLSGKPGYIEATSVVTMLDRPASLDRSQGDVHAQGNPHIQTDPRNFIPVARLLSERLQQLDPVNAAAYRENLAAFDERWRAAIAGWQQRAAPLAGLPVVVQHRNWVYLTHWLRLERVATLESKPGLPPSSAELATLLDQLQQQPARAILRAAYQDERAAHWLSEHSGIPVVDLPYTVGGNAAASNLFTLFDDTIDRLLEVQP
jgi:zinc/manganese transport system substrate-binding protein